MADSIFCTYCGTRLSPEVPIDSHLLDDDKRVLREAITTRSRSDHLMRPWIVVLPFIVNVVMGVFLMAILLNKMFSYDLAAGELPTQEELMEGIGWVFIITLVGNVFFYLFYSVIGYVLIDRWNKHYDREKKAWDSINSLARKMQGSASDLDAHPVWGAYDVVSEPHAPESNRRPLFWAFMIILPLIGLLVQDSAAIQEDYDLYERSLEIYLPLMIIHALFLFYMLHFMTEGIQKHHRDSIDSVVRVKVALARAGLTAGMVDEGAPLPSRSSALYIAASVLTSGIFLVYWWYVVVKDTNTHHTQQAKFEEDLARLMSVNESATQVTPA